MYSAYEAIDTKTTDGDQMWQSGAVLPSEHEFGKQGGVTYS